MCHILRHGGLLQKIIAERRIIGKPPIWRNIQVIDDLTKGAGYAALRWAAEERRDGDTTELQQKIVR